MHGQMESVAGPCPARLTEQASCDRRRGFADPLLHGPFDIVRELHAIIGIAYNRQGSAFLPSLGDSGVGMIPEGDRKLVLNFNEAAHS